MIKTLAEIRLAFVEAVTAYLSEACRFDGEELALKVSAYLDWNWPIVEACYKANGLTSTSLASDFTCDFVCKMLAGRV